MRILASMAPAIRYGPRATWLLPSIRPRSGRAALAGAASRYGASARHDAGQLPRSARPPWSPAAAWHVQCGPPDAPAHRPGRPTRPRTAKPKPPTPTWRASVRRAPSRTISSIAAGASPRTARRLPLLSTSATFITGARTPASAVSSTRKVRHALVRSPIHNFRSYLGGVVELAQPDENLVGVGMAEIA